MSENYKCKEVIEPKTGTVHRFYTYKGKPCRRVPLNSRLCKQLAGYALIEKDLRSVGIWLKEIDALRGDEAMPKGHIRSPDRKTYNVIKGLFVAALTFYGKCFSKCEGRPVKLERSQMTDKYRQVHDDFIKLRHNFAAHSGNEGIEHVQIAVVIPRAKKHDVSPTLYRELLQPDLVLAKDDIKLIELIEHAQDITKRKIDLLHHKILNEEVYPLGREHWLKV